MNPMFKVLLIINFLDCTFFASVQAQFNGVSRSPPDLSLYRYEGNFYPTLPYVGRKVDLDATNRSPQDIRAIRYLSPVQLNQHTFHNFVAQAPIVANSSPYQVAMNVQTLQQQSPNSVSVESERAQNQNGQQNEVQQVLPNRRDRVTRHYHDIYLKLKTPQDLVFGHVLNWPGKAEKKVEKRQGSSYKGQVIWADKNGGYGEHYWDLAQGAL